MAAALQLYDDFAKENGSAPSVCNYMAWRSRQDGQLPAINTIVNVYGSWNAARRSALGAEASLMQPGSERRWTKQACLDAIRRYERHCEGSGGHATRDGYQEWQKDYPDVPSVGPVERYGAWNDMRKQAAAPKTVNITGSRRRLRQHNL